MSGEEKPQRQFRGFANADAWANNYFAALKIVRIKAERTFAVGKVAAVVTGARNVEGLAQLAGTGRKVIEPRVRW